MEAGWAGRLEGDWKTNPQIENNLWKEGKPPNGRWGLLTFFDSLSSSSLLFLLLLLFVLRPFPCRSFHPPPPPRSSLGRIYPSEEGSQVDNSSTLGC